MDWETPPEVFARLDGEFHFTLDVCATRQNAKCPRYFTRKKNGLAQSWGTETCWMNPPYGREIGKWMAKAKAAARGGATVVCLVPARTDTRWWHENVSEVRFMRGRIRFVGAASSAPFPSAIVIFRPDLNPNR